MQSVEHLCSILHDFNWQCARTVSLQQQSFLWLVLAEMLLREYALKEWFVIPPLVTNVSAQAGETWAVEIMYFK